MNEHTIEELKSRIGTEIGVSPWCLIDQKRIDEFAEATDDHQFIHVDPAAAAKTPFRGTIAHGFLSLSMLSHLAAGALPGIKGRVMGVNYGFEKVRFVAPVRSGAKIRGRFTLAELTARSEKEFMMRYAVSAEIEGSEKPALIADWLTLIYLA